MQLSTGGIAGTYFLICIVFPFLKIINKFSISGRCYIESCEDRNLYF